MDQSELVDRTKPALGPDSLSGYRPATELREAGARGSFKQMSALCSWREHLLRALPCSLPLFPRSHEGLLSISLPGEPALNCQS